MSVSLRRPAHLLAFAGSGLLATALDIGLYELATRALDAPPLPARAASILVAMLGGWLAHRRYTFGLRTPPRAAEFVAYAGVAWVAVGVNYAVFVLLLNLLPDVSGGLLIVGSSGVAMMVSYAGMRFGVFRKRRAEADGAR